MSESLSTLGKRLVKRAETEMDIDAGLLWSANTAERALRDAAYVAEVNLARLQAGVLTWDGLIYEAANRAVGETIPEIKREALEELALVAIANIASLDRQMAEFQEAIDSGEVEIEEDATDGEDE